MKKHIWTLQIEVQGKNEADAIPRIEDRIHAFILRGASVDEGKIEEAS